MRLALIAIVAGTMTAAAFASPPYANELLLPAGGLTPRTTPATTVPKVARGQFLGLACADVAKAAGDAVRVVLSLAADEAPTGYTGVLATEQTIDGSMVHVRVPDLPDLADHTVRVKVFVTDRSGVHSCDAGRVKIV